MVTNRVHQVALDYLLNSKGEVDLAVFTQGQENRSFSHADKALFASGERFVQTSQGDYGLCLVYSLDSKFGETKHFLYREGFEGETLHSAHSRIKRGKSSASRNVHPALTLKDED